MGLRVWGGDRVSSAWPPGPPSESSAFGLGSGAEWTGRCAQPQRSCRDSQRNLAWGWGGGGGTQLANPGVFGGGSPRKHTSLAPLALVTHPLGVGRRDSQLG